MGGGADRLTEQEAEAFGHKLRAWGESLPEREQQLLNVIVERAARTSASDEGGDGDEVAGYFFSGVGLPLISVYNAYSPESQGLQRRRGRSRVREAVDPAIAIADRT